VGSADWQGCGPRQARPETQNIGTAPYKPDQTTINRSQQPPYLSALFNTMAPIRRYLRITKYSVLECRIYVDNPVLAQSWLLNPRNPVLPRVIESVRPLVLPKLREEKERSKAKGGKKKTVKDMVVEGMRAFTWGTRD
jgi:hypothetical protein